MRDQSGRAELPRVAVVHLGRNGGGPKFTFELARSLAETGAEVLSVIAADADNRTDFDRVGRVLSCATFSNKRQAFVRAPVALVHAARLAFYLRSRSVDAVVVGMEQIWQPVLLIAARLVRCPVLLCVHDATVHPGEHFLERAVRACQRRLSDGFITFSDHVADELAETAGNRPVHRTVHAGFGTVRDRPRTLGDGVPVVGFFGRLARYKGLGLGYEAVRTLRARGRRVRFHVVGGGDDPALALMRHPDDELSRGWIGDAEVQDVLDGFDVLLLPYIEASQSGVLAYALTGGLPSVVTPVGGLAAQALATGVGEVAERTQPDSIADALLRVLDDPDRYRELSARGLASAESDHSWDRVASDVIRAIQSVRVRRWSTRLQSRFAW